MFYSEQKKQFSTLNRRTFFLYLLKASFFSLVGWRLYNIQILNSKKYQTSACRGTFIWKTHEWWACFSISRKRFNQSRSNGKRTGALFIDNQILLDSYWVPVYIINSRNYYDQKIKQV